MESKTMKEHKKQAPLKVKVGIITLSDSKSNPEKFDVSKQANIPPSDDLSGKVIMEELGKEHEVVLYKIIPDNAELLLRNLDDMRKMGAEIIISTGGTGIGKRDITIETITPLFSKELKGFGEIFRYESYKEMGTGAMLSRATAGVWKETLLVALPGSPNAVKIGMNILKPELGHLVKHMKN